MAVTTSYEVKALTFLEDGDVRQNSDITKLAGGGRVYSGDANPLTATNTSFVVPYAVATSNYASPDGLKGALAGLTNGNLVFARENAGAVAFDVLTPTMTSVSGRIEIGAANLSHADVAATSSGGFVVSFQKLFSGSDTDILLNYYSAAGTLLHNIDLSTSSVADLNAAVATLDNGNIAVAWTRMNGANSEIWTAVYDQAGNAVAGPSLVDNTGTVNDHVAITAANGGYALAYEDSGAANGTTDITVKKLNLTGGVLTTRLLTGHTFTPEQANETAPALTRLSNGLLAVSFTDFVSGDHDITQQVLDGTSLSTLTSGHYLYTSDDQYNGALAGFGLQRIAMTVYNASTAKLEVSEQALVRVRTGDDTDDLITASNDMDHHLIGNGGNDTLKGAIGEDRLEGASGSDILDGAAGADTMTGGAGDDTYSVENAGDLITELANEGIDTVKTNLLNYTLGANVESLILTGAGNINGTGNSLDNLMIGTGANNNLIGGQGNDTLAGGAGDDLLNGGTGGDRLIGGAGNDTYQLGIGDTIIEGANEGIDTVLTSLATTNLGPTLENVTLIGAALNANGNDLNNLMTGNAAANLLAAGNGNDTLSGLQGNDTLNGGAGNDRIDGGAGQDSVIGGKGNDTFYVDSLSDTVTESADQGSDTVITALNGTYTLAANVENLILTGTGQTGRGNDLANSLTASVNGSTLAGGKGNDTYYLGDAGAQINEAANQGTDTIITQQSVHNLGANVENLILAASGQTGIGNDLDNTITATSGSNVLVGQGGADRLVGGIDGDTLLGGAGADTMLGGIGNDTYFVDDVADLVTEIFNAGIDTITTGLGGLYVLGDNLENLVLSDSGQQGHGNNQANLISSADGNNSLYGDGGNDTLIGGSGYNRLHGGMGADMLSGGNGFDDFHFDERESSPDFDTITNFSSAQSDTIYFSSNAFTGLAGTFGQMSVDNPAAFSLGTEATTTAQRIIYDQATGALWYDEDGSAAAHDAVLVALLSNHAALSAADIWVFP